MVGSITVCPWAAPLLQDVPSSDLKRKTLGSPSNREQLIFFCWGRKSANVSATVEGKKKKMNGIGELILRIRITVKQTGKVSSFVAVHFVAVNKTLGRVLGLSGTKKTHGWKSTQNTVHHNRETPVS